MKIWQGPDDPAWDEAQDALAVMGDGLPVVPPTVSCADGCTKAQVKTAIW
jgi:hypothetical protein